MRESLLKIQSVFSRQQVEIALRSQMPSEEAEQLLREYYDHLSILSEEDESEHKLSSFFSREEFQAVLQDRLTSQQLHDFFQFFENGSSEYIWSLSSEVLDALAQLSPSAAERVAYLRKPPNPLWSIVIRYYSRQENQKMSKSSGLSPRS